MSSFITYNSIDIYDSLKNGNDYTAGLNKIFFKNEILSVFCMDFSNNFLYYTNEKGETVFKMTLPDVTFELDNTLKLKASYTVIVPVMFAGQQIYELEIPQTVTAYYNVK